MLKNTNDWVDVVTITKDLPVYNLNLNQCLKYLKSSETDYF